MITITWSSQSLYGFIQTCLFIISLTSTPLFIIVSFYGCVQHHHLSNRERKEQAKRERKERRTEEKRKGASKKPSIDVISDSIGSLTI